MNKIDYIRGKALKYPWGKDEKEFTIAPKTNGELIDLVEKFQEEWETALDVKLEEETFIDIIRKKPSYFINEIVVEEFTEQDFLNGYPNDIYNLFQEFKEVNFTFLGRLKMSGSKMLQNLVKQK